MRESAQAQGWGVPRADGWGCREGGAEGSGGAMVMVGAGAPGAVTGCGAGPGEAPA